MGVIGPGRIADVVAADLAVVPHAELVAVASRSMPRAEAFAARHGISHTYDGYQDLIGSADVDVVYVATPHPLHRSIALAVIRAGKAVLVEKAFTSTLLGAQDLVAAAHAGKVFAMEAMWTRFLPAVVAVVNVIKNGEIGDVRSVQIDLGDVRDLEPAGTALGSGALLDLGPYLASVAQLILGDPDQVTAHGTVNQSGLDVEASVFLTFRDGRTATLLCSLRGPMSGHARIFGTAGWIDIPHFYSADRYVIHRRQSETVVRPYDGHGYFHELVEVAESIRAGRNESAVMPLAGTLVVQRILDTALSQLGTHYPEADSWSESTTG